MRLEPEAARLRRAGLLWPENLTDEELSQELSSVSYKSHPISAQMLQDEQKRRQQNKRTT